MTQRIIQTLFLVLVCSAILVGRPIFDLEYQIIFLTGVIAFIGIIINSISKVLFEIRWLDVLFVTALLYGLLLADSRAAYLATIVSLTVFVVIKFRSRVKIRIIHIGSLIFLFSGIVFLLYMYRPSSANARLGIWRICVHAIEDAPVFGYGTGSFQKTYMLKQADYLNNVSNEIRSNADEVKTAFNVVIELLYEQGIIGLFLWCSIIILSIKGMFTSTNKHNPPVFLFPIISFLTFSLFSYPHLIWGLTCPLISFLSTGGDYKDNIKLPGKTYKNLIIGVESTLLTIMLFLFVSRVCINRNLTKYSRFEIDCQEVESNHLMNTILYHYPSLLSFYIDNQIATEDYGVAISTITQLRRYKNSYKLEKDLAYSYEITGDTANALVHYDVAHNMCPGYLEPLFSQFLIYESRCDSIAVSLAKEIIDFSPKITNPRTEAMKSRTIQFLKTINNF